MSLLRLRQVKTDIVALFLSIVVILVIYALSNKYKASLISTYPAAELTINIYHDLNHDGISNRILFEKGYGNFMNSASILIYDHERIVDQWPVEGRGIVLTRDFIDDFDHDGKDEIFIFSQNKDSLYLSVIDPFNYKAEFNNIPVCRLYDYQGKFAYDIQPAGFYDTNNDKLDEFFFSIVVGYALKPRKLFAFYPGSGITDASNKGNTNIWYPTLYDFNNNGIAEIYCSNMATGNCPEESEYSDWFSWLMVFTPELDFLFPPVMLGEYPSLTQVIPMRKENKNYLLIYQKYMGIKDSNCYLALYDLTGKEIGKSLLQEDKLNNAYLIPSETNKEEAFLVCFSGDYYIVNSKLGINKKGRLPGISDIHKPERIDIDNDGFPEIIFRSKDYKDLIITRNNMHHPVIARFPERHISCTISPLSDGTHNHKFTASTENDLYTFQYTLTAIYKYWYLFIPAVLLLIWLAAFIIQKIHELRTIYRDNDRKNLATLQMKALQNQVDPHFTFNLLEAFRTLLEENDKQRAEYIFDKYSGLLKYTVLNSDKAIISLKEELDFVKIYLELEQFRCQNRFDYEIHIGNDVDMNLSVPKMLVHIFAENAVKHGVRHLKDKKGKINIDVNKEFRKHVIVICDNGIGRKKAGEKAYFSTGKGLDIINEMLKLYERLYKKKISYITEDIQDGDEAAGTKVTIKTPV